MAEALSLSGSSSPRSKARGVVPAHRAPRAPVIEESQREPSVLVLRGEFDVTSAHRLRESLESRVNRDLEVILDLADTTFLDAAVLGVLASANGRFPGGLSVRQANPFVVRVLSLVDMDHLLST
jgi:anti-anti-sigma factor